MAFTFQSLRILLVARDDDPARSIRSVLAASTAPRFVVEHAANGWEAQRQAAAGAYGALVLDNSLSDTDSETLLGRLKAISVGAPALVLTSASWDHVTTRADDYLPWSEGLTGNTLARAIVAMVLRHDLTQQLAVARDQAARATSVLAQLAHDLASPLGVVTGMTQVLLSEDDNGLSADGRACLEDVAREALRACDILKHVADTEPGASPRPPVVLPVAEVAEVSAAPDPGTPGKMVLIADDDAATRRLVRATLGSDQYRVLEAADGKEAWRLIREHHPAVAILDWQMPFYTGLELTDVIKGDPQVQGMTVILLTGRSTQADREAGELAHADLFLVKPFSPQELLGAVEQAVSIS